MFASVVTCTLIVLSFNFYLSRDRGLIREPGRAAVDAIAAGWRRLRGGVSRPGRGDWMMTVVRYAIDAPRSTEPGRSALVGSRLLLLEWRITLVMMMMMRSLRRVDDDALPAARMPQSASQPLPWTRQTPAGDRCRPPVPVGRRGGFRGDDPRLMWCRLTPTPTSTRSSPPQAAARQNALSQVKERGANGTRREDDIQQGVNGAVA